MTLFQTLDWIIIALFLVGLTLAAILTQRYVKSVADFLVAGRCGGRYLLTTACAMNFMGAATIISQFQVHYDAGFTALWWSTMLAPVTLFVYLSGWVVYRWRATRVMTQAQLFELCYSRNYRVFSGFLLFATGVFGVGIIPAVAARFFIGFCGFPEEFQLAGMTLPTFPALVGGLVLITWFYTFLGGQITVMVTDFLQGIFFLIVFMVIFIVLMITVDWQTLMEGVAHSPPDRSLIHPFRTSGLDTYNMNYFLWIAFATVFLWPVHGMQQPTVASAKTPHESHMATILANIRHMAVWFVLALIPLCAYMIMHHEQFSDVARQVTALLADSDPQAQREMQVPVAISFLLPKGLLGAFAAVVLAAFITTNDSYFLIFGSIFIQDVILPFRKKPLSPGTHIWMLRFAIVGLGIFVFLMSVYFPLKADIPMFWALMIALQAGAVCIPMLGALYWKYSSTWGCWAASIAGFVLSVIGFMIVYNVTDFALNGYQLAFVIIMITAILFIVVSLLDSWYIRRDTLNLDKLLHRGRYAVKEEQVERPDNDKQPLLYRILKIDKEFTRGDKIIYFSILGYSLLSFAVFVVGTVWNLFSKTSDAGWSLYWRVSLWITLSACIIVTIWLTIGGFKDLYRLFKDLDTAKRNLLDDGRVVDHKNADEAAEFDCRA